MAILQFSAPERTVIDLKVVGVGGAGCHVINRLIESGFDAARCIAIDTFNQVGFFLAIVTHNRRKS